MKKETQVDHIKAVFDLLEKQKQKQDADGVTYKIDSARYNDPAQLEKERNKIFQNHPIVVGAIGQLKENGDYFLYDQSDVPIMVVKGQDGLIRAFINMCRHRGVRLLEEQEGHIKRNIVCPYHAWAYDTAGCLKAIFHPQGFKDVDKSTHSLIELDCVVKLGMIFVVPNPEAKGKIDFEKWFEEVDHITEGFEFGEFYPYYHTNGTLNCNWKLLVDGGLEGYHFKIAHAKTIGPYFLDNLSLNTDNKLHSSIIFPKRALKKMIDTDEREWNLRKGANVLQHIFPNTIILIEPDHIMVVTFYPIDEKTTQSQSFMLLPTEPKTQKERDYWDLNGKIFWDAIAEDNEMAELQQKSFNGYTGSDMTVGSYEKLLVQFEGLVDKVLSGSNLI